MSARMVHPRGRGLLLDSHPVGAAATVREMHRQAVEYPLVTSGRGRPTGLVIGASAGYGLAATIAGIARYGLRGVGVARETPATATRTATAGWYRTIAAAEVAAEHGASWEWINGDCFDDATKRRALDAVAARFAGVDYLIYSVAAPKRHDARSGLTRRSVVLPMRAHRTKTLLFEDGAPQVGEVSLPAATREQTQDTVAVMGGSDWAAWVEALTERGLVRPGFTTVALSYIGSELTAPLYRRGTIGAAKQHLEDTAARMDTRLRMTYGGRAITTVAGAAVTQASTAIPGIGLYMSLLRRVLGENMHSPLRQAARVWDQISDPALIRLDELGRLRLDGWELDVGVQSEVAQRWRAVDTATITQLADPAWFTREIHHLSGFGVHGVDYTQPVDIDRAWP